MSYTLRTFDAEETKALIRRALDMPAAEVRFECEEGRDATDHKTGTIALTRTVVSQTDNQEESHADAQGR